MQSAPGDIGCDLPLAPHSRLAVTNGGTEGCLMGLYTGRTNLPGARLFFSKEAHYCIPKAARLLK